VGSPGERDSAAHALACLAVLGRKENRDVITQTGMTVDMLEQVRLGSRRVLRHLMLLYRRREENWCRCPHIPPWELLDVPPRKRGALSGTAAEVPVSSEGTSSSLGGFGGGLR